MMQRLREWIEYLETLEFRALDSDSASELWSLVLEVVRNPASNMLAAILLLIIVTLSLLILALAVIVILSRIGGDDDDYEYVTVTEDGVQERKAVSAAAARAPRDPLRHHKRILWGLGLFLLLLVVTSVSSQSRTVCLSCHDGITHTAETQGDPHASIRCTGCHESGGMLSSVTLAVPARTLHIVGGLFEADANRGFGTVSGSACRNCHGNVADEVVEIPNRGLLVSHREPLDAGAGCMDCHMLNDEEKVGQQTAGMGPCLRCHDGEQASAECSSCHTADVSQAVLVSRTHEPRQLVGQPNCYTCHDPGPCDSCHGVRLPHPPQYRWSHMYDAAKDLWFDGGRTCGACHTYERNSCYQAGCHYTLLAYHYPDDPAFPRTHGRVPGESSRDEDVSGLPCSDCHSFAQNFDDPCEMCHRR